VRGLLVGQEIQPVAAPPEHLDQVATSWAKTKYVSRKRIL